MPASLSATVLGRWSTLEACESADQVADVLRAAGARGIREYQDPVAVYLKGYHDPVDMIRGMSSQVIAYVHWDWSRLRVDADHPAPPATVVDIRCETPRPVREFIEAFNGGAYVDLALAVPRSQIKRLDWLLLGGVTARQEVLVGNTLVGHAYPPQRWRSTPSGWFIPNLKTEYPMKTESWHFHCGMVAPENDGFRAAMRDTGWRELGELLEGVAKAWNTHVGTPVARTVSSLVRSGKGGLRLVNTEGQRTLEGRSTLEAYSTLEACKSADEVADVLRAAGARGFLGNIHESPVSVYLNSTEWWDPWVWSKPSDDLDTTSIRHEEERPIREFLEAFNDGAYVDLAVKRPSTEKYVVLGDVIARQAVQVRCPFGSSIHHILVGHAYPPPPRTEWSIPDPDAGPWRFCCGMVTRENEGFRAAVHTTDWPRLATLMEAVADAWNANVGTPRVRAT